MGERGREGGREGGREVGFEGEAEREYVCSTCCIARSIVAIW